MLVGCIVSIGAGVQTEKGRVHARLSRTLEVQWEVVPLLLAFLDDDGGGLPGSALGLVCRS